MRHHRALGTIATLGTLWLHGSAAAETIEFLGWSPDNSYQLSRAREGSAPFRYSFCLVRAGMLPSWPKAVGTPDADRCARLSQEQYDRLPGKAGLVRAPVTDQTGPLGDSVHLARQGKKPVRTVYVSTASAYAPRHTVLDGLELSASDWIARPQWRSDGKALALLVHRAAATDLYVVDLSSHHPPAAPLLAQLASPDQEAAREAIAGLRNVRDPAAVPALLEACAKAPTKGADTPGETCDAAAEALRWIKESVTPLAALSRGEQPLLRRWAAGILGKMRAAASLAEALYSPDEKVRATAADALHYCSDEDRVRPLQALWQKGPPAGGPALRGSVVRLLAESKDPGLLELMLEALADPAAEVRKEAARWLGERQDSRAQEALLGALREPARRSCAIVSALGAGHDPRAAAPLVAAMKEASLRECAVEALSRRKERSAVEPLLGLLKAEQDEERALTWLDAVAGIPDPRIVPPLLKRWRALDRAQRAESFTEAQIGSAELSAARIITAGLLGLAQEDPAPLLEAYRDSKTADTRRYLLDLLGALPAQGATHPGLDELLTLAEGDANPALRQRAAEVRRQRTAAAASTSPDASASAANTRGMRAYKRRAYKDAAAAFQRAIALEPGFMRAHYNLACVAALSDDLPTCRKELGWLKRASDPKAADQLRVARTDRDLDRASLDPEVRGVLGLPPLAGMSAPERLTERGRIWTMEDSACGSPGYRLVFKQDGVLDITEYEGCDESSSETPYSGKWTTGPRGVLLQAKKVERLHGARVEFGSCDLSCWEAPCEQATPPDGCFGLIGRDGGLEGPFRP